MRCDSNRWMRRLGLAAIAGAVAWSALGCAQERDPINRVQANAMSKHFFVGADLSATKDDPEFYMRNTVVDVPYGAGQDGLFTASYAQPLSRVKWEITEQNLVARQTYEHIQDSDHNGTKHTNNGQVVASFTIQSHFDIRRSYNPQTGEENNLIEENATDRPWFQREFFRVDWSKNLVTDGYEVDTLSQLGVFGGVKFDPMSYYVEDPKSPDAPVFADKEGYFDITTKAFATPQVIEDPYEPGSKFPFCFYAHFFGNPAANCNPTEVTLRLSFNKVVDKDYEPTDQDGKRQDAFGWFTVDRYGYERNYGILDEGWHRFAAKYNIWQQSHISDGKGNYAQCAVDYWRDAEGNIQKFKVDAKGQIQADGKTGMPILADANDPKAIPYAQTPVGTLSDHNNPYATGVHRDEFSGKVDDSGRPVTEKNGTEDECELRDAKGTILYPGSRCDEFSRKCTIPTRDRKIKTIPWYYGLNAPPDLFPSTANALGQWNLAVKRAAQIGKAVDLRRIKELDLKAQLDAKAIQAQDYASGLDAAAQEANAAFLTSEEDLLKDAAAGSAQKVPDVFVLCHNPTIDSDHPACHGPNGQQVTARLGDIRYNSVNMINSPQAPSPWGIMVDADDPLTGEKVSTSVNEWSHVLDIASQGTEDLLRWINGEISDEQVASGQYLREWISASALGTKQHMPQTLDPQEVLSRVRSIDTSMSKLNGLKASDANLPQEVRRAKAARNLAVNAGPSMTPQLEATRQKLLGSEWEARLMTPEWLQAAGYDPKTPVAGNDAVMMNASPLRGMDPQRGKFMRQLRDRAMAHRASCTVEQPEPDSLVGMARQASRLYPLPDRGDPANPNPNYLPLKAKRDAALHQWIREQFHISVIAHEMGHSMGLRHNFTGTFDALNYHPEYWQLRTRNGKEHFCGYKADGTGQLDATAPHTNGADCVGPRWVDPVTDAEVNGLIWKFGSTTVMDYPGDQTQDMNDIGPYDKAAMRFGYADIVDIDTDAVLKNGAADPGRGDKASAFLFALDGFGGIVGNSIGGQHYSTFNDRYGILGKCSEPTDPSDPLSAKCDGFALDYVSVRDMKPLGKYGNAALDHLPSTLTNFSVDAQNRVRHPYMFGSDEYADTGNVPVFRFDSGADSYEQFQFLISTYENRYIFDNFRRDRATFNTRTVISRANDRYFDKIQGMTKSLALLIGLETNPQAALADPGQLMPLALGASDGLAMFARIMTRPEPGAYTVTYPADPTRVVPTAAALNNNYITLPPGDFKVGLGSGEGRYLHSDYDYTQGYYWSQYQRWAGSYYEKHNAVYFLTEAYNHFLSNSKEDYIDGRYKNLNYASIYPNQIRRLFANVLQNDQQTFSPFIVLNAGKPLAKDAVARVRYLPWEKYDETDPTTINLDYSKDAVLLDPLVGWEQQFRMLNDVFWYGPTTLSMDFVDQARIFSPGGSDTISIDPAQQVHYKDPQSGIIYVARTYGREMINIKSAKVEKGSGARMLQFANQLAASTYVVDAKDAVNGELTYHRDANGQPVCVDDATCFQNAATLKSYSANLDIVRNLTRWHGYFPRLSNNGN